MNKLKLFLFSSILLFVIFNCNTEVRLVFATDCNGKYYESFVVPESRDGTLGGYKKIQTKNSYVLGPNESICRAIKSNDGSNYYPGVLKCNSVNGVDTIEEIKCPSNQLCVKDINTNTADCKPSGGCKPPDNSYYYQIGVGFGQTTKTRKKVDFEFTNYLEKACFGNQIKECNPYTSSWLDTSITCTGNKECIMTKDIFNAPMQAECMVMCKNPDGFDGEKYCNEAKNEVSKCELGSWKNIQFNEAFPGKNNCTHCVDTTSGPVCDEWENSDGTIGSSKICVKIPGQTSSPGKGEVLTKVCDSTATKVYMCKEGGYDDEYELFEDCSKIEGFPMCGPTTSGEIGCISQDAYNDYLLTIKTTTSNAFFCDAEGGESDKDGIDTAIGCIPITINGLIGTLLPTIFGIAGGIAFLMMIYGFIMISTSSGDEKKMAEARKIVTSAITGLLFSLFALFLYRLIAVDILQIPGIN